jgi:hypothetical protein
MYNDKTDYIKECELKKAINNIDDSMLFKFHNLKRKSENFTSERGLRRRNIIISLEKLSRVNLRLSYDIFIEKGIEESLLIILKIKNESKGEV